MKKQKKSKAAPIKKPEVKGNAGMYDAAYPVRKIRFHTVWTQYNQDYYSNVTNSDWQLLLSRAREVFSNVGAVKNACHEIADLCVGDGWTPKFQGEDAEWGRKAEAWLNEWFRICDIKGSPNTLIRGLKLASIAVDRDGDCLLVLTKAADGKYPRIQWLPAHVLGNRDGSCGDPVKEGIFTGYRNYNGVIVNDVGNVIGYYILGTKKEDDQQISVNDAQLVYDPEYLDQYRGLTSLASALLDWDDYKTIKAFEVKAIKQASNLALSMEVPAHQVDDAAGVTDDTPFATQQQISTANGDTTTITERTLQGGEVMVFEAGAGAKLNVLENNRPGQNTANFLMDHVLKHAFLSMRIPIEFSYDLNSRGAVTKLLAQKIQRRVEDRKTQVLYPVWKRVVQYGIGVAIKYGMLPANKEWWKFEPTYPRSFSVEANRDTKSDLDLYSKGMLTGTQIAAGQGYDYEECLRQKAQELALAKKLAVEYGINPNELIMATPNGNAPAQETAASVDPSMEEDNLTDVPPSKA